MLIVMKQSHDEAAQNNNNGGKKYANKIIIMRDQQTCIITIFNCVIQIATVARFFILSLSFISSRFVSLRGAYNHKLKQ